SGLKRGLALWALGRHAEAVEILESQKDNPAIAVCLARSLQAVGRADDAVAVLRDRTSDPVQATAWLHVLERIGDRERFAKALAEVGGMLTQVDQLYFKGRQKEFDGDAMGAISAYDEALSIDEGHPNALFRLAVNIDLRGEDKKARELYERA